MRARTKAIVWDHTIKGKFSECSVPTTEADKLKLSADKHPGFPLNQNHNIAHVYPCGSIRKNVGHAVMNWDGKECKRRSGNFFS